MTTVAPLRSAPWPARFTWIVVAALLALYAGMALSASSRKGLSFDETEELAVGYNIWLHHDFRMESANGDFLKRWATLPYLISRPKFPDTNSTFWRTAEAYAVGYQFMFENGNAPEELVMQGRFMNALLGVAAGLVVFLCARAVFGALGGLFALGIFAFSPNMLAFGGIVSTEMSICLTLLGSTWCAWQLLHRITWGRLLLSLFLVGLLVLSKPSAILIFPIITILIGIKLLFKRPLVWELGRKRTITSRFAQIGLFGALTVLHGFCGWLAIWAHYDFRFLASPNPADPGIVFKFQPLVDPVNPIAQTFLDWSRDHYFLPQGFIAGVRLILRTNDSRDSFMNGQWADGGWLGFFPYAMWAKTPPLLLALFLFGLGGWWWASRAHRRPSPANAPPLSTGSFPSPYDAAPFFILIVVYFGTAIMQNMDIGHRHILPIYPAIYILTGGPAAIMWARGAKWAKILVAVLLGGMAVESMVLYPNYLAYFSPLAGGPAHGYEHLVDSSLDWGMDLPGLKKWLNEHNPGDRTPVFLAYFGTDNPDYYGIKCKKLPCVPDWLPRPPFPLAPGIYAISATLFQSIYTPTHGPWTKQYENDYQFCLKAIEDYEQTSGDPAARANLEAAHPPGYWEKIYGDYEKLRFARLCAWLRHHRPPDDNVGYSILIWHLDLATLDTALLGPPPELGVPLEAENLQVHIPRH